MHPSKKNSPAPKRNNAVQPHPIKRSKSTEQLIPKKGGRRRQESEQTFSNTHSLAKSKSSKSLKPKVLVQSKVISTSKKTQTKKKTLHKKSKKIESRSSNEVSSILTQDMKTVKAKPEYFLYCNNYIPIENSAQRRLVYRIQMIDLENKSTTDAFLPLNIGNKLQQQIIYQERKVTCNIAANTEPHPELKNQQIGTTPRPSMQIAIGAQIQSQGQETQTSDRKHFEQIPEKCFGEISAKDFGQILTQLQFLYLPNQNNFEPFNTQERIHYGQMLETIAKKMLSGTKNTVAGNTLTDDQVTVLLYQRQGVQVGALEFVPVEGFPTHLLAVLAYLKNLFCYIDYSYRDEVIANLRQFYGYNYNQRVNRLSQKLPHEKDKRIVLSPEIFKNFEHQMFKDYDFPNQEVKEAVHIHNKAVFDSVNSELQTFRPFFTSEGEPFPWSINLGMTHYDITQQALYIIFMQVKQKIQKQLVSLCGMHLDFDDKSLPSPLTNSTYCKKMEEKTEKMLLQEIKKEDDSVALDYEKTLLRFALADQIFYQLISQIQEEVPIVDEYDENEDDFQYFS